MQLNKELTDSELAKLDGFFLEHSDKEIPNNVCFLDGYLSAICSSPRLLMPSEWQASLYGEIAFKSMEQANEIIGLIMRFYNATLKSIQSNPHIPIYDRSYFANQNSTSKQSDKTKLIETWCSAYLEGVRLANPELLKKTDVSSRMLPIIGCSELTGEEFKNCNPKEVQEFVARIPSTIKNVYEAYQKYRQDYLSIPSNKTTIMLKSENIPGRNDLCYCGSGKKFKKCHLN